MYRSTQVHDKRRNQENCEISFHSFDHREREAKNKVEFDEVNLKFRLMSYMFATPSWPGSGVPLYDNDSIMGKNHENKVNNHGQRE